MLLRLRRFVGKILRKLHLRRSPARRESSSMQSPDWRAAGRPNLLWPSGTPQNHREPSGQQNLNGETGESTPESERQSAEAVSPWKVEEHPIPHRRITTLHWTGSILFLKGYFYLENIPMTDEDLVSKELILQKKGNGNPEQQEAVLSLNELPVAEVIDDRRLKGYYTWAGFSGQYDFSRMNGGKPLSEGEYVIFIRIAVQVLSRGKTYTLTYPLGNVRHFMTDGFQHAKMEYFSAKRQLVYNLIASYDNGYKSLKIISKKLRDFDPREFTADKHERRGPFYIFFQHAGFHLLYLFFCLFPLKKDQILFASDSRTELGSNFLFVYDELRRRHLNYRCRFSLKGNIHDKRSYREWFRLAHLLATSKYILLDDFYPEVYPLRIRRHAQLIQLWHAVGAFKTFGYSRIGRVGGPSSHSKNHRNYTKAIVSSHNVARHYAEGFGITEDKVVATGIPRTDVFFDKAYQQQAREKICREHPYLKGKKVILFAPTFRGNGQQSAYYPTEVLDLKKLYKHLGKDYVFLLKIHPFVQNHFTIPYQYSNFIYDFSDYRDINDLLFMTDILITDYSSVCFEFALLDRPMLFFAFDLLDYIKTRDFYYDYMSFIPGSFVRSTDEIITAIETGNFRVDRIQPFVHYFFDDLDGKSSARVVDQLIIHGDKEDDDTKPDEVKREDLERS